MLADAPLAMLFRFQVTTPLAREAEMPGGDWIETIAKAEGNDSVATTPVAVDGPRLVTEIEKVILLVTRVVAGDAKFEIPRSAAGLISVVVCAELLAGRQSEPAELVTVAMFVMVPVDSACNVIVTVAVALLPI